MRVTVYTLDGTKDTIAGTITWNGKQYVLDPQDSPLLVSIVSDPVYDGHRVVHPREGDAFLTALPRQYRSAYMRVGMPQA